MTHSITFSKSPREKVTLTLVKSDAPPPEGPRRPRGDSLLSFNVHTTSIEDLDDLLLAGGVDHVDVNLLECFSPTTHITADGQKTCTPIFQGEGK